MIKMKGFSLLFVVGFLLQAVAPGQARAEGDCKIMEDLGSKPAVATTDGQIKNTRTELNALSKEREETEHQLFRESIVDLFMDRKVIRIDLSEEKKNELVSRLNELEKRRKTLEEKMEKLESDAHTQSIQILKEALSDPEKRAIITGFLNVGELQSLEPKKTVCLLLGNNISAPTAEEAQQYAHLARRLVERGYNILFDADSSAAPIIAKAIPNRALGITADPGGKKLDGANVLTIPDPYMRLVAFRHAKHRIVTPDSITGTALRIDNQSTLILDVNDRSSGALVGWRAVLDKKNINLGVHYEQKLYRYRRAEDIMEAQKDYGQPVLPYVIKQKPVSFQIELEKLNTKWSRKTARQLTRVIEGRKRLGRGGGAVVYGSNKNILKLAEKTYDVVRPLAEMGIGITTGGSAGVMLPANMAAFDAGAQSIGIPVVGEGGLTGEHFVPTDLHTLTIPAAGYDDRLPLLSHNRPLVIMMPGGSGTMQELAVTLLSWSPQAGPKIILVDPEYYKILHSWLRAASLPKEFTSGVWLVEDGKQAKSMVREAIESGQIDPALLLNSPNPWPRTNRSQFIPPKNLEEDDEEIMEDGP